MSEYKNKKKMLVIRSQIQKEVRYDLLLLIIH